MTSTGPKEATFPDGAGPVRGAGRAPDRRSARRRARPLARGRRPARRTDRSAARLRRDRRQAAAARVLLLRVRRRRRRRERPARRRRGRRARARAHVRARARRRHGRLRHAPRQRRGAPRFARRHADAGWRGEPRRFGEGMAILVGDFAFIYADVLMRGMPDAAHVVFDELRVELCVGQSLDLVGTAAASTEAELANRIAVYKSGKYTVERPLHLGAALAGGLDRARAGALRDRAAARRGVPAPRRRARRVRRRARSPASPSATTCARASPRRWSRSRSRAPTPTTASCSDGSAIPT